MNGFYGEQIKTDIQEKFTCISEYWMLSEKDEKVKDYWKIGHGINIVEMIDEQGLENEVKKTIYYATSFG